MAAPAIATVGQDAIEEQVVAIVAGLVEELGGPAARMSVSARVSLERDLGIGSLERVELLLRLEEAFGIRLPDSAMTAAESPRDLARAVLEAEPPEGATHPAVGSVLSPGTPAPPSAATLTEVLDWHAQRHPERTHVLLATGDGREQTITYGDLWTRARTVGGGLRETGIVPGEPVALMLRTAPTFFDAFFGVLGAGGIPVPLYPPHRPDRIAEYVERQAGILRNAGARVLVTFPEAKRVGGLLRDHAGGLTAILSVEALAEARPASSRLRAREDPALIQYTSGSTGAPKGVLLSHGNLLANIRAIGEAIGVRPDDVTVSWLPLYHDMGLIGAWLGSLYHGIPATLLSPLAFLARPSRWLWALHTHRGTVSPAPNFAFDLCVRKIADAELKGLDLSAWRLALNGAEPVGADTIARFLRRFAAFGFLAEAMCPCTDSRKHRSRSLYRRPVVARGWSESTAPHFTRAAVPSPPRLEIPILSAWWPAGARSRITRSGSWTTPGGCSPSVPRATGAIRPPRPGFSTTVGRIQATSAMWLTATSSSRDDARTSSSRRDVTWRPRKWRK